MHGVRVRAEALPEEHGVEEIGRLDNKKIAMSLLRTCSDHVVIAGRKLVRSLLGVG